MKTVLFNYISHETPENINFRKWFEVNEAQLINLYILFKENIISSEYFDVDFENNDKKIFRYFIKFIWDNSSKYIPDFEFYKENDI